MVCLLVKSISVRRNRATPLLLLTLTVYASRIRGIKAFSSALFLFQSNPRPQNTRRGQGHNEGVTFLDVLAEPIDTNANAETSEHYLLGGKDDNDNDNDNDTKNILTFQSSFQRQSNPLPQLSPNITLDGFLLNPDHITSAGKSMHSKIVPTTTELFEEWTIACDRVGACPPNPDQGVIMSVRTAGISIPGLTVEWSALIGINLVHRRQPNYQQQQQDCDPLNSPQQQQQQQQQHPELEFVLIKDDSKISSGAKPIVWIYNKLTRSRSSSRKKRRTTSNVDTKLFTRLGFYKTFCTEDYNSENDEDDNNESVLIRCAGTMKMKFRIPSMLGKLIFSSDGEAQKAQAERKMSNLITKQIEKVTEQNVLRWEEHFRSWITANEGKWENEAIE